MRPWVLHTCHSTTLCHLSVARTSDMLRRFYWWIGKDISTRWWLRRCLQCKARKTSRQTIRWPTLSLPLPHGPGILVSVDYVGSLPTTPRGNSYILLFTDRFSRRADVYATSEAEFTASGTADILVDRYIFLWGCPVSILSDNGLQICSKIPAPSTSTSASTKSPRALIIPALTAVSSCLLYTSPSPRD